MVELSSGSKHEVTEVGSSPTYSYLIWGFKFPLYFSVFIILVLILNTSFRRGVFLYKKVCKRFGFLRNISYISTVIMSDMINKMITKFKKKYKTELDAIGSFLFIALVFYLTYFALWVFCPC